jgi:hypothetical protein
MIGIGGHLEKNTKIKILGARAREYNAEYERLEGEGVPPEEIPPVLAQKAYEVRHSADNFAMEPYKVLKLSFRLIQGWRGSEAQSAWALNRRIKLRAKRKLCLCLLKQTSALQNNSNPRASLSSTKVSIPLTQNNCKSRRRWLQK